MLLLVCECETAAAITARRPRGSAWLRAGSGVWSGWPRAWPRPGGSCVEVEMGKIDYNRFAPLYRIDNYRFGCRMPITGEYRNLRNRPSQSKTSYIVSDRRALLKPVKVQELTFLNCDWHLYSRLSAKLYDHCHVTM